MTQIEQHRLSCEAREWLKRTSGEPLKINQLLQRIAQRRGKAAADQLREAMRAEYRKIILPTLAK